MRYASLLSVVAIVVGCGARPAPVRTEVAAVSSDPTPAAEPPAPRPEPSMLEVDGDYCPNLEEVCLRWLDPESKLRCAEFQKPTVCRGATVHKHFWMDRYEWPNKKGEKPRLMVTWYEAGAACASEGKRLCTDSEWALACEGQEGRPYPYGYDRDATACNIDHDTRDPNEKLFKNPATRDAEVARLDQRVSSGSMDRCVSPYGVHDMTGNVDEWVVNEHGNKDHEPWESGLKGGYWGPVRTRCRPMTTAHYQGFAYYQIGFRCCADQEVRRGTP